MLRYRPADRPVCTLAGFLQIPLSRQFDSVTSLFWASLKGAIVGFILRVDVSAVAEIKSDSTQGISQLQSNYILSTFLELAMRFLSSMILS